MESDDEFDREKDRIDALEGRDSPTAVGAVPASGLLLIASGDDWLVAHIAAQLVLLAVIAVMSRWC